MAEIELSAKLEGSANAEAVLGKRIELQARLVGHSGSGLGQQKPQPPQTPTEPDFTKR